MGGSGQIEWQEEDVRTRASFSKQVTDFTGTEDTEGHALSKERLLRAVLHDSVMSHATSQQLSPRSKFNSVCKVKEVSGQSVAHLNWSATCSSTRNCPPYPKHRTLLLSTDSCVTLTLSYHGLLYENVNSLKRLVIYFTQKVLGLSSFFVPPREGLGLELLCWGYDHILTRIMRDVIPSELSKALLW